MDLLSKWPERGPLRAMGPSMREIAEWHAAVSGTTLAALKSPDRTRSLFRVRQAAMAEIYSTGRFSYPQIGRFFNRDHSSVIYAVKGYRALAEQEAA